MNYRNEKGQALVEFALTLPLLLVVLFGIIEFSFIMYNQAVITNASREGARAGIVLSDPRLNASQVTDIVDQYCSNHLISFQPATPTVAPVSTNWVSPNIEDTLTVTVTYDYSFLIFPNFLTFGNPIQLSAKTVMRYE